MLECHQSLVRRCVLVSVVVCYFAAVAVVAYVEDVAMVVVVVGKSDGVGVV